MSGGAISQGKNLFKQDCNFIIGAVKVEDIPEYEMPEIAFAGRSNVGKSSLLNALTRQRSLARTSKTPGCTQQVNFFMLGAEVKKQIMLVDLPGYGYAKASKTEIAGWNQLINDYLRGRRTLRRVMLLIDSRHGVKPNDERIMNLLDEDAVTYQVVLTKVDKIKVPAIKKLQDKITKMGKDHPALYPEVLYTSSEKGQGLDDLRSALASFLN